MLSEKNLRTTINYNATTTMFIDGAMLVGDSNSTIDNVMDIYEIKTVDLITFSCMLVLCLIGIYGNSISILIFSQPVMRSSINILLTGLSTIDLGILLLSIPVFVVPVLQSFQPLYHWDCVYPFVLRYLYPLVMIAQTSSVWTFVIISTERYLAVCCPFKFSKLMSAKRAKQSQCLIVALSVVYNFIRFWEFQPFSQKPWYTPYLRENHYYFIIYITILYVTTHFAFPFTVILVLNIKMVKAINEAHRERRRLNPHQTQEYRTAQMIIVVTTMFGVCNTLAFVLNIWEAYQQDLFEILSEHKFVAFLLLDISNILIILNSATTFVIYLIYCNRYRLLFKNFNRCKWFCSNPTKRKKKFEWTFEFNDLGGTAMVLVQRPQPTPKTSFMSTTSGTTITQIEECTTLKSDGFLAVTT